MLRYWIWLASLPGISGREKCAVLEYFGSPEDCYYAPGGDYSNVEALRAEAMEALGDKSLEQAEAILGSCERRNIQILTLHDSAYPGSLRNIADPPIVLYYSGTLPDFDSEPMIGVVGTRRASAYGLRAARQFGKELAGHGGTVVSGMAEGIDAAATWGALEAKTGAVGILGCGLDIVYPRCNRDLFRKMEQQGCLISEYPPGTKPNRWQFPERNRIISGISCGVLVVEAPEKSGALITARQALEQGRDVYAVPGNIGVDSCLGSNALLRDGAGVVMSGWDILENYAHRYPDKIRKDIPKTVPFPGKIAVDNPVTPIYSDVDKKADGPDAVERMLLSALGTEEALIDTLIAKTGLPSAEVLAALTMLEVQGMVTTRPGGWVSAS